MAIVNGYTTLAQIKAEMRIGTNDTADDTRLELRELQLHPGRVLRVLHAHTRPERLAPHKHPRLVKTVQPTRVLRVVGATYVVGAPHLEQRNVLVHLRVGGRRGHEGARRWPLAWPLRVVVVPNELQVFLVDSQTCLIDP
jgi:hypothetical protein